MSETNGSGYEAARPEQTVDDTDLGWSEPDEEDDDDRLQRDKPPHY